MGIQDENSPPSESSLVSDGDCPNIEVILPWLQQSIESRDPLLAVAALEHIARYCANRINTGQDIDDLIPCVSRDFRANVDNLPVIDSMPEYWAMHQNVTKDSFMYLIDLATHMDWPNKRADVLMSFEVHGRPPGIVRDTMVVMEWKAVDDRWVWFYVVSMRSGDPATAPS